MFKLDFTNQKRRNWKATRYSIPLFRFSPAADHTVNGIRVYVVEPCANVDETITVIGEGFWPNTNHFYWQNPIGGKAMGAEAISDANGKVQWSGDVSIIHSTAPDPTLPQIHRSKLNRARPIGGIELSDIGGYIVQGIYETLALAFLSTIIGAILAIPFAFLAARNLMTGNPFTR